MSKEEVLFQKNSVSQNNIISEISSKEELLNLIEMTEFKDNFFYALFDPLTNNNIYPLYSNNIDFFFEKISLFHSKPYGYQINSNIFENVLFDKFNNPIYNLSYINYLYNSNQIKDMCAYLSFLDDSQKNFEDSVQYNLLCLIEKKQYSQILLLLEIYNQDEIDKLNSKFLVNFLSNKEIDKEYNLSELGIIDKYIVSKSNNTLINIDNINNLLELEIYIKSSPLELYQLNNLFKNRILNVHQYLSMMALLIDKPSELKMYEEISNEINYNKKLRLLESYIPKISLDVYDLSRLVNDQFKEMRITSRNLKYIDGLMLLSLYENSSFLENLIKVLIDIPEKNIDKSSIVQGLKSYLTETTQTNIYIDEIQLLESPLMKFLFLNGNLKFSEVQTPKANEYANISISPIYLFNLAENFNLLESYSYYLNLSEKYYSINEYDLYFLNKYLIENEYLRNELIKLIFKVHLSDL
tara:strand:- start:875 stop:2278 length:1404 start_codon:yes stop_codon:yes gene_type:complete